MVISNLLPFTGSYGSSFLFPAALTLRFGGPEEAKKPSGGNVLRLIQIRVTTSSFEKTSTASQDNSPQARITDSSSTKAVSFSSARTMKR